ncbi:MAG: efflux RND transporter periplasmic adaptor subunit [Patescibacteria group bacterium]|nr:efflux RND transporter periplasmic adaptor subunit [Patescibacteria group bacterium]
MFQLIKKHKIVFLVVALLIVGGGYYGYNKFKSNNIKTSYITAAAEKGTIVTSVSSSGQISASNQVDINAKVSGEIKKIAVASGQEIKEGELIAQIDAADAYKTVRDAQVSLASAQLSMDKLKQAASADSILQAENAVASAKTNLEKLKLSQPEDFQTALETKQKAEDALDKTYEDTFSAISDAFVDFPTVMAKLNDILYSDEISSSETSVSSGQYNMMALLNSSDVTDLVTDRSKIYSMQAGVEADYKTADTKYDDCLADYKNINRYYSDAEIENLLNKTAATAKAIAQSIKNTRSYLDAWSDFRTARDRSVFSKVTEYKNSLITYSDQINSHLSGLQTLTTTIKNNKISITAADNDLKALAKNQPLDLAAAEAGLKEKEASLADLKAGADSLDIKSQELSLQQKRNSLYDAQSALADYTIKAPFDGVIAAVNLKVGDSAGSTAIATIITKQQIAEISLNEVDAAKIKVGLKANMTFDAIEGLEITGKVAEVDAVGTVSQGVVTYNIKIVFDAQDDRVKPGMSVNAAIITNSKTDVLMVASSAVKTDNSGANYVQILDSSNKPVDQIVEIGITDDTNTEIISGLSEDDKVVTQTVDASASTNKTTTGTTQKSNSVGGFMMGGGR